jgi:Family of unknown function (DUF6152)
MCLRMPFKQYPSGEVRMNLHAEVLKKTLAMIGSFLVARPTLAHHSFMAEFDQRKPVTLEGVVTNVEWINPHTFFYIDVKDKGGKSVKWALETGSPSALLSRGWTRDTIKIGDRVKVYAYRAKDKDRQRQSGGCKIGRAQGETNSIWRPDRRRGPAEVKHLVAVPVERV